MGNTRESDNLTVVNDTMKILPGGMVINGLDATDHLTVISVLTELAMKHCS